MGSPSDRRRAFLSVLFADVFGSASTIAIREGTLNRARFAPQCAASRRATVAPARSDLRDQRLAAVAVGYADHRGVDHVE